jgi:hypothetical protein
MQAAMRAERIPHPVPPAIQAMTAAYIHRLPSQSVHTAVADQARTVRVQLLAASGGVGKEGQKEFVAEATQIVADVVGDPYIKASTWVIVVEAMAGWGVAGEVLFKDDAAHFFEEAAPNKTRPIMMRQAVAFGRPVETIAFTERPVSPSIGQRGTLAQRLKSFCINLLDHWQHVAHQ